VIGAGIETALASNWTFKLEYRHLDSSIDQLFSTRPVTTIFANISATRLTDDIFRIGVNYKFGESIVAKYRSLGSSTSSLQRARPRAQPPLSRAFRFRAIE
jgi:hypothetical protein